MNNFFNHSQTALPRQSLQESRWVKGLVALIALAILSFVVVDLWQDRQASLKQERLQANLLTGIFFNHVSRQIDAASSTMTMVHQLVQPGLPGQATLAGIVEKSNLVQSLSVVSQTGQVLASSDQAMVGVQLDWQALQFLPDADAALSIGWWRTEVQMLHRMGRQGSEPKASLALAKRLPLSANTSVQWLALIDSQALLADFLPSINAQMDALYIFNAAGQILVSSSPRWFPADSVDKDMPALQSILKNQTVGSYKISQNETDVKQGSQPKNRFEVHFQSRAGLPIGIAVALSEDRALGQWWSDSKIILGVVLAMLGLAVWSTRQIGLVWRRRELDRMALAKAKQEAEAATQANSSFLAQMSHEIRTPINIMVGMTELALSSQLQPDQREYLEMARSASQSLLRLIDDILDFTRLGADRLSLEAVPFELHTLCQQILKGFALQAEQKNIGLYLALSPELPLRVVGDPLRLGQVLQNLLGNAIKFSAHGWVKLTVQLKFLDAEKICCEFDVSDTGIGIAPDMLTHIFTPFVQADAASNRKFGGSGLGLSIAKNLVTLMQGEIHAKAHPEGGSTFIFTTTFATPKEDEFELAVDELKIMKFPLMQDGVLLDIVLIDANPFARDIMLDLLKMMRIQPMVLQSKEAFLNCMKAWLNKKTPGQSIWIVDQDMLASLDLAYLRAQEPARWLHLSWLVLSDFGLNPQAQKSCEMVRSLGLRILTLYKSVTAQELRATLLELAEGVHFKPIQMSVPEPTWTLFDGHLLVVEDTPMNQQLAKWTLQKFGCKVDIASDGLVALEQVKRQKYDLILMDLQMPGMDGLTATREIRRFELAQARKPTPIVAMTAHVLDEDRQQAQAAGMQDFLVKPVSFAEFQRVLEVFLKVQKGTVL